MCVVLSTMGMLVSLESWKALFSCVIEKRRSSDTCCRDSLTHYNEHPRYLVGTTKNSEGNALGKWKQLLSLIPYWYKFNLIPAFWLRCCGCDDDSATQCGHPAPRLGTMPSAA